MIGLIVLLIWLIGWVFSIYPIYAALTRTHQENLFNDHRHNPLDRSDIAKGLAGATGLGMIWWAVLPVYLSFLVHKGRRPKLTDEAERQITSYREELEYKDALKEMMTKAKAELEEPNATRDYDINFPRSGRGKFR